MPVHDFIRELRRRNVVRVAAAYLAVAWLVIQLVNEVGPILEAPEWLPRAVLLLLAAGFVIALVLSWIYELTDRGLRTTAEVDRDAELHRIGGRQLDFVIIGALLLALVYFVWESRFAPDVPPDGGIGSVAVLPFRDLSPAGDQAYLAEGFAEELLNALARVPGLRVVGRTSSFKAAEGAADAGEIADRLEVTHLLEGSVRTAGRVLRVTARLVDARTGTQVFAHQFEGDLGEVFTVQDRISQQVIDGLQLRLATGEEATAPPVPATGNLEAYDAYLLGRYHLARRNPDDLRRALEHFRSATAQDPGYAPAWAGLSATLAVSPFYAALGTPRELAAAAERAALQAIELEPGYPEAWATLGAVHMFFQRDWERAEQALKRAVELGPNNAHALNLYGDFLYLTGDLAGALEVESRAASLEPLSAVFVHEVAVVLGLLGDLDQAMATERRAIRLDPGFVNAWSTLGRLLLDAGRGAELEALLGENPEAFGPLYGHWLRARLLLTTGQREGALREAEALLRRTRAEEASPIHAAVLFARAGEDARAAELVREAHAANDPILVSPLFFYLPEDWPGMPRLQAALDRPGLSELFDRRRANIAAGRGRIPAGEGPTS